MTAVNLKTKIALITGASSGIGAATAELFARLNASSLILVGRNKENLKKTGDKCRQKSQVFEIVADLTKENETKRVVDESIKKYGRFNILVNCAGILEKGSIEETNMEQYDRVMTANYRAMYQLTMLCVPTLVKYKGSIVNVSSVNGTRSFPGLLAYNTSKAAVDHFTRCVALELASKQVRVNAVNPGVIITELQKRGGLDDEAYAKFLERCKETHALGRPGNAEEVAEAIAFLASDNASYITGATLPVDGGRHAMCPR